MTREERYMKEALALAREAAQAGEVPVGCVIVRGDTIVGRGRNRREEKQSTASHAEMEAIAQANETLGTWRLEECELFVTLEPCPMCAGAILNARVKRVWYGARDEAWAPAAACLTSIWNPLPTVLPWWAVSWPRSAGRFWGRFSRPCGRRKRVDIKINSKELKISYFCNNSCFFA